MRGTEAITCRELVELVTDYIEDALPAGRRTLFEQHLATCPWCATYVDQIHETRRALGTLTEHSISGEARDALLQAFRGWKVA